MSGLHKFLALTPAGRAIVLRSLLLLPAIAVLLRTRGMARAMAWLGRQPGGHDTSTLSRQEIARLVNAAASLLRVQCLPRSLVLWHNLREHGTSVQIRLGVSKLADGGLSAHAWVEVDGLALIDDTEKLGRYTVLPSVAIARNLGLSQRD